MISTRCSLALVLESMKKFQKNLQESKSKRIKTKHLCLTSAIVFCACAQQSSLKLRMCGAAKHSLSLFGQGLALFQCYDLDL